MLLSLPSTNPPPLSPFSSPSMSLLRDQIHRLRPAPYTVARLARSWSAKPCGRVYRTDISRILK